MLRNILIAALCGVMAAPALFGGEILRFDSAAFQLANRKGPGGDELTTGAGPLPGNPDRTAAWIGWNAPRSNIEVLFNQKSPEFPQFDRGEFILTIRPARPVKLRRIVLRMRDRTGEMLQYANRQTGQFPDQTVKLTYTIDPADRPNSAWGGNQDKKIDWPLRFAGFAVDFSGENAPGRIYVESLEFRPCGEAVSLRLDTGHPLHLLLPERKSPPELVLTGQGTEPAVLAGTLELFDADGKILSQELRATVPVDGEIRLPVDGDFSPQGFWKIQCMLRSEKNGLRYEREFRVARMNPAGPTPGPPQGFLFGICSHPECYPPADWPRMAEVAGLCGAKIVRVDFGWKRIQPHPDQWNFTIYDGIVEAFAGEHIEVLALLDHCPEWAIPEGTRPKNPRRRGAGLPDLNAYAAYCETAAHRYKGKIRFFEIWNEPDAVDFANFPASDYMRLLEHGYDAIKKAAPDSLVMNGGIASAHFNTGPEDLRNPGILNRLIADGGRHFDLFAFHGHGSYGNYIGQLEILEKCGIIAPDKPWRWYSNETAQSSASVGEKAQAETLFRKLLAAWAHGAIGYNWYNLREKGWFPPGSGERHFGLVTSDLQPKPVYVTYNMLANTFRGGKFLRELPLGKGTRALLFEDARRRGVLALWSDGETRTWFLSGLPAGTRKIDLYGNESPVPMKNGLACLKISESPFALRMPAIPVETIEAKGALLACPLPLQMMSGTGERPPFSISLANPTNQTITLTGEAKPPRGVRTDPAGFRITLRPGEKRDVAIRLIPAEKFDASPLHPAMLELVVTPEGLARQSFFVAVVRAPSGGNRAVTFRTDRKEQFESPADGTKNSWRGPDDLSADIAVDRKGKSLRLKTTVRDDRHVQPFRGSSIWQGDSIQFELRMPDQNQSWRLGLARLDDGTPAVFCWNRPIGFADPSKAVRLETERDETAKQTVYRAEIPFEAIGLTPETAAGGIRFNLLVNDNDGDGRKGFLAVAPGLGSGDDARYPIVNLE